MNLLLIAVLLVTAPQANSDPARALAVHFADGRTTYHFIQPNGGMWTPGVTPIEGADTSREGKRLFALDIRHVPDGSRLVAHVSLLYGGVSDVKVPVGTMPLTPGNMATFDLSAYGLQPVRLSVVNVAPLQSLPVPAVHAPSPGLDVQVTPVPGTVPRYVFTATNRDVRPIVSFRVLAYHEGREAPASRRLANRDGGPVVMPGNSYTFDYRPMIAAGPGGVPGWLPAVRYDIVDIVWFDLDQTIADYCAAWSEPDVARRRELLNKGWAQGGTYTDPEVELHGQPDLMNYITRFHQRFPGVKIVVTSKVDVHHGVGRFSWRMIEGSGATRVEGIDFVEFTPEGRIKRIVGFFGPLRQ